VFFTLKRPFWGAPESRAKAAHMPHVHAAALKALVPRRDFLIGIDSDGAAFDTMELKQKECFIPQIVRVFQLQRISKYVRETAEFVNLYSRWRGTNRFPALLQTLDLLRERPEVRRRGAQVPGADSLRKWVSEETRLGNPALQAKVEETGDPFLRQVLEWSLAVNAAIAAMGQGVEPFPGVRECLEKAGARADLIVVSQTPLEALEREWREHGMDRLVRFICAQEHGTKSKHLELTAGGKYPPDHVLMIGDAYGDLQAAQSNAALFFPIHPGKEDVSWQDLQGDGLERFFAGAFAGEYQRCLLETFKSLLPENPPW